MSAGSGKKKEPLGKILLQQKLVTPQELETLLSQQKRDPSSRLASKVIESGKVSEVELLKALSEQQGLPGIDLTQVVLPLENLTLVPADIAHQHMILPITVKEGQLFLAMADPSDKRVVEEIEFVTGRRVFPYVALHEPLRKLIETVYAMAERGETLYVGPHVPEEYLRSLGISAESRSSDHLTEAEATRNSDPATSLADPFGGVVTSRESLKSPAEPRPAPSSTMFEDTEPETPLPVRRNAHGSQKTVLVVDDEEDMRRLLRRMLTERGLHVVEASKGLQALQAVRDHVPDLILLDAMLPEIHGFDICRRIKGSRLYGNIPIVILSAVYRGWRFAEDLRRSYGVHAFLEKPFKVGDVLQIVDKALQGMPMDVSEEAESLRDEARDALAKGIEAYQAGDLDTAIAHLREGTHIDPLAFRLHYHLGLLYGRRQDTFQAIQELEAAVDLQPRHFAALKNLAVLYQQAGFRLKALEFWERAMGCSPNDVTKQEIREHLISLLD